MSSLRLPGQSNFASQLKKGYATLDNVLDTLAARCFKIGELVRPFFGPLGQKVLTVNKFDRIHITSDCHRIFSEVEISGPDSTIFVDAINSQYEEAGDGAKLLVLLATELIAQLNALIAQGVTRAEVLDTYQAIGEGLEAFIKETEVDTLKTLSDRETVVELLKVAIMPKARTHVDLLANLIYDACQNALFRGENKQTARDFGAEAIRVCKVTGGTLSESRLVAGLMLDGHPENPIHLQEKCKVAVYNCGFDYNMTEATATVLFKSSAELAKYAHDEDAHCERLVASLAAAGVKVAVCNGKSSALMLHYANKHDIMVLSITSKWMIRRVCVALDARPMVTMQAPITENLGYADRVKCVEINEQHFVELTRADSMIATLVLHGSTEQLTQAAEETVSSGVNLLKCLARDPRLVAGAGVFELNLARAIRAHGQAKYKGDIKSYIYDAFAAALECVSKVLIENTGVSDPGLMIAELLAKHRTNSKSRAGCRVNADGHVALVDDVTAHRIQEALYAKTWAIKYALGALDQICRVDMIICARLSDFVPKRQDNDWDYTQGEL